MGDPSPAYTLDEALLAIGFGKFQSFLLVYGALGWVAEAMELMILSFIGPALKSAWELSSGEESLISTVVFAGMLIGAYFLGHISDRHGRKKGFLGASLINSSAGLLSAFSPNYITLVSLRFLTGIGLGGGFLFTSWFLEFIPAPNRGSWMMIFSSFWTIGIVFEASLAWMVMPKWGWRWLIGLSSSAYFLVLLLCKFAPESPRYLCAKGKFREAQIILEKAAQLNSKQLPPGILSSDKLLTTDELVSETEDSYLLSSPMKATNQAKPGSTSMLVLFSHKLFRTTLLLWFLYFGSTFAYYGIILLTSQLSTAHGKCGASSSLSDNIQDTRLYVDTFVTNLAELPGVALSAVIVDRVGRKISMAIMFFLGFVLLVPLVIPQNQVTSTALLFGARMFVSASFTVACIYAPEVYPTDIRATAVGIATSVGRIGGMICPLVAVGLVSDCHLEAGVGLFLATVLLTGISVLFLPFETKGKNLSDIAHLPELRYAEGKRNP